MSEELKPCPLCGATDLAVGGSDRWHRVICRCLTAGYWADNKEKAIDQWNTRPIEDTLRARVAELEAAIKVIVARFDAELREMRTISRPPLDMHNWLWKGKTVLCTAMNGDGSAVSGDSARTNDRPASKH